MQVSRESRGLARPRGLLAVTGRTAVAPSRRRRSTCPGIDKPVIVVTGDVTGTETWANTNYYVLRGAVFVADGAHAEHPGRAPASSASRAASAR